MLRVDVAEDDRTVCKSVPESTAAGADVCDGGLLGGVSGGISTRLPRRSWVLVPLCASNYQRCPLLFDMVSRCRVS